MSACKSYEKNENKENILVASGRGYKLRLRLPAPPRFLGAQVPRFKHSNSPPWQAVIQRYRVADIQD